MAAAQNKRTSPSLRGGTVERRIERADGKVEHKSVYSAQEWELMGARAKTGLSQAEFAQMIDLAPGFRIHH